METILIVDDNARLRALLREWFTAQFPEYRILEAVSGEEAVHQAASAPVKLVVMDIGLPGMSGIETAHLLTGKYPGLRIVILSIHEEERYRQEAASAGVRAYVPKGKLREELFPVIQKLLDAGKRKSAVESSGKTNACEGFGP